MCLVSGTIVNVSKWNWDGDHIVHDCTVPSARNVIGSRKKYPLDIREFLVSEKNSVMSNTLREDFPKFLKRYYSDRSGKKYSFFESKQEGSFDFKVKVITNFVSQNIAYLPANGTDPWLFPDETLCIKEGDCEDRAFLIASLMLASGISSFNVRVALGKVKTVLGNHEEKTFDHVWVMYKNEIGRWRVIDPLKTKNYNKISQKVTESADNSQNQILKTEYIPYYIFNDYHLWSVNSSDIELKRFHEYLSKKFDFNRFHPTFAGEVHKSILEIALKGAEQKILDWIDSRFWMGIIDVQDMPNIYHPFDHFDNSYIKEGWEQVFNNLRTFEKDNEKYLDNFGKAAHAIADFYAHTTYAHFANRTMYSFNGTNTNTEILDITELLNQFDPDNLSIKNRIHYDMQSNDLQNRILKFNLNDTLFSYNKSYCDKGDKQKFSGIIKNLNGKVISGRYAQPGGSIFSNDSQDTIELLIDFPDDLTETDQQKRDFVYRAAAPHHNEIGVDKHSKSSEHQLYRNETDYNIQYKLRRRAAILHIRDAFKKHYNGNNPINTELSDIDLINGELG
ncbi:MAG: transglutaminase domain-containing protein [Bacteroidetes bacterium]|nr:MAG: transglutaminase domain-containing protein [Bacteroidota bacterium]